jgi:hypothetical protein
MLERVGDTVKLASKEKPEGMKQNAPASFLIAPNILRLMGFDPKTWQDTTGREKDRLIELQAQQIETLKAEINWWRQWDKDRSPRTEDAQKIADLESRIAELRNLLGLRTTEAVAQNEAEELEAKIVERERERDE